LPLLRAIVVPILLVIFASPLPVCAIALAATGENCHDQPAVDPVLDQFGPDAPGRSIPVAPADDVPDDDRQHDSTCACDADRPTSKSDPISVPAFVDLPLPLLLPPPVVNEQAAFSATVLAPPALAAVSLPLLN
jgi:hypothetical protein